MILSTNPPNIVEEAEKRFPKIQIILGIAVGILFLGLVIFFIVNSPAGYEKYRKRKAQVFLIFFLFRPFSCYPQSFHS